MLTAPFYMILIEVGQNAVPGWIPMYIYVLLINWTYSDIKMIKFMDLQLPLPQEDRSPSPLYVYFLLPPDKTNGQISGTGDDALPAKSGLPKSLAPLVLAFLLGGWSGIRSAAAFNIGIINSG